MSNITVAVTIETGIYDDQIQVVTNGYCTQGARPAVVANEVAGAIEKAKAQALAAVNACIHNI